MAAMEIIQALKFLLAEGGWTQETLAKNLGVSQPTISRWLSGADPRGRNRDRIFALASGDGVPPATIQVPVLSWISASGMAEYEGVLDTANSATVDAAGLIAGDWIALTVDGDSMDRISPPGSTIYVNRKDKRLVPNACYVIADSDGLATYKRYRPSPDRFEPVSTNPSHEPIFPTNSPLVVGRVRRSVIDL